jgi:hypothetical protein
MAHYLVVAHQTAESPELVEHVSKLAARDPGVRFTLLVPATSVQHLLTWWEGERDAIAQESALRATDAFEAAGASVSDAIVGDSSPIHALQDELRRHPRRYQAIIICTLPPGLSRWLQLDFLSQAQRTCDLPVIHVEAQPVRALARRRR